MDKAPSAFTRVHGTRRVRSLLHREPQFAVELPGSTRVCRAAVTKLSHDGSLAMEWAATAILRAVCRAIFATHSLQAFLNKKQGIGAFHANLVQSLSPRRHHSNDSLQFHLGNGG